MTRYFYHPESDSYWTCTEDEYGYTDVVGDGLSVEIDEYTYRTRHDGERLRDDVQQDLEDCPECKNRSVVSKWSGVKCTTPGCGYWFCY